MIQGQGPHTPARLSAITPCAHSRVTPKEQLHSPPLLLPVLLLVTLLLGLVVVLLVMMLLLVEPAGGA